MRPIVAGRPRLAPGASLLFVAALAPGCDPGRPAAQVDSAPSKSPSAVAAPPSAPPPARSSERASAPNVASAAAAPSAATAAPFASSEPPPIDWKNTIEPEPDGPELQERARRLFEAVVKDEPSLAEPFWFPLEPFEKLKDIRDPAAYWRELHRAYERDVHRLHQKRDWQSARFESFELGSNPKWVPPGNEANKIGYYRSFRGKIHYSVGAERSSIEVHTVITWQGRFFVTHLCDFKKDRCKI